MAGAEKRPAEWSENIFEVKYIQTSTVKEETL
jgi:hypothetical protein